MVGWLRENLGRLTWPAYVLAISVGGLIPFALYCLANMQTGISPSQPGWDTEIITIRWWAAPTLFLVLLLALLISWLQTPHLAIVIRKLGIAARGRGLMFPLLASGLAFYVPVLVFTVSKELDLAASVTATSIIQSAFSVYLVVLSVTAVIRYFFVTATVQTGISGFTRNLTADLEALANRGKGRLTISLPWLAFGKVSLDAELFEEFRNALERCLSSKNIAVEIYTLSMPTLEFGARKTLANPVNKIRSDEIDRALECEREIRGMINVQIIEIKKPDLMECVVTNERLYAVHTLLHKAREEAHLGNAFISVEIDDENICEEYRRQLKSIAEETAQKKERAASKRRTR